ncbi:uncharacterized protein [Physcomitrium patens]|uniref:Myb-like domain-containing protein n=1 Tax=Physcomitrium patens TaxID=3218 RepID=A0A7I4A060_PHYPA|nr:uncharacterized protein LOC112287755 isoform X2 [Physcomitrium patens]|eukprot:XP_024386881.1 uncharacterized protein LOC112287755 isoform X2 [Physcomitrella patens]
MAQSAMAGSGPNVPVQAKANHNSAVKAHLQSNSQNAAGNGTTATPRYSSPATMDVASAAPPSNGATNGAVSNGNGSPAVNGGENTSLKHDSGLALEWSAEEQSLLEETLNKHAALTDNLAKYIKIAALLNEKTVRDVALRVRWMTKENGKRRKDEVQNLTKKTKDKKDKAETTLKAMPTSNIVPRSPMPMYSPPPIDNDDGISNHAIGGETGVLLEQNAQVIAQIRSNLASMKMQENTDLLVRFRDNIFAILNGMTNMPGIMSQMPPLPVKLNTELADSILPKSQASTPLLLQS